jgi:single-strand DNA-binding protein
MLPSGDEVVSVRLIVPRSASARRRSKQRVDTIECSAWSAKLRKKVRTLVAGDEVVVGGELRRRFTRGSNGPRSWVSVDLETCERASQD